MESVGVLKGGVYNVQMLFQCSHDMKRGWHRGRAEKKILGQDNEERDRENVEEGVSLKVCAAG